MKRSLACIIGCLLVFLSAGSCRSKAENKPLVFMAGYKPQASLPFVGVYMAQENGYFAGEHLTVDIRHTAGHGEHLQLLVAGTVDITTQDAAVLLKRRADPGLPLVSLALIGQQGQQAFVALTSSGIQTLDDWRGKKIGFKGTPPPDLLALLDVAHIAEDEVELINVGFDPRILVEEQVDIYPVYNSNEPYLLESWGYELTMWRASDYDIATLGLCFVSTPEIIEKDPERIAGFMRAVLRGIEYAKGHPEEAVAVVLKYAGQETDADHMRFMLMTELQDADSPISREYGLGWQTSEQWQNLADSLLQYGALAAPVDVSEAFTNEFLSSGAP